MTKCQAVRDWDRCCKKVWITRREMLLSFAITSLTSLILDQLETMAVVQLRSRKWRRIACSLRWWCKLLALLQPSDRPDPIWDRSHSTEPLLQTYSLSLNIHPNDADYWISPWTWKDPRWFTCVTRASRRLMPSSAFHVQVRLAASLKSESETLTLEWLSY